MKIGHVCSRFIVIFIKNPFFKDDNYHTAIVEIKLRAIPIVSQFKFNIEQLNDIQKGIFVVGIV